MGKTLKNMHRAMVRTYYHRVSMWTIKYAPTMSEPEWEQLQEWINGFKFTHGRNAPGVLPRGNRGKK